MLNMICVIKVSKFELYLSHMISLLSTSFIMYDTRIMKVLNLYVCGFALFLSNVKDKNSSTKAAGSLVVHQEVSLRMYKCFRVNC